MSNEMEEAYHGIHGVASTPKIIVVASYKFFSLSLTTDCVNKGSCASVRFVPTVERLNIPMHTCSIHHEACKTLRSAQVEVAEWTEKSI